MTPVIPPECIARMQELERENEILRMERVRLEASYRNADSRRYDEQHAEIAHIKVSFFHSTLFPLTLLLFHYSCAGSFVDYNTEKTQVIAR